jgi:hypothetical protein
MTGTPPGRSQHLEMKQVCVTITLRRAMSRYYRYFYYTILTGTKKIWESKDNHWTALFFVTALIWTNVESLLQLPSVFGGPSYTVQINRSADLAVFVGYFVFNWFYFVHNERSKRILEEFSGETPEQSKRGSRRVKLFALGTVVIFALLNIVRPVVWGHS